MLFNRLPIHCTSSHLISCNVKTTSDRDPDMYLTSIHLPMLSYLTRHSSETTKISGKFHQQKNSVMEKMEIKINNFHCFPCAMRYRTIQIRLRNSREQQRTVYCGSSSGRTRTQSEEVFLTFPFIVIAIYRIHIFLMLYLLFVSASRDFHFSVLSNDHADRLSSERISLGWLAARHYVRPIRHQCNSFIVLRWR